MYATQFSEDDTWYQCEVIHQLDDENHRVHMLESALHSIESKLRNLQDEGRRAVIDLSRQMDVLLESDESSKDLILSENEEAFLKMKCVVRYVDFGNSESVKIKNIVDVPKKVTGKQEFAKRYRINKLETSAPVKLEEIFQLSLIPIYLNCRCCQFLSSDKALKKALDKAEEKFEMENKFIKEDLLES